MQTEAPKPKRRLWLKLLFALSLALNLAVLGAVAGAVWRHGGEWGGAERHGGPAMLRALSPEDRRAVFREARAAGAGKAPERAAASARMDRLVAVLGADPLDEEALRAIAAEQRTQAGARLEAISAAWQARVLSMSAQERAAYAQRLAELSAGPPAPRQE